MYFWAFLFFEQLEHLLEKNNLLDAFLNAIFAIFSKEEFHMV